MREDFEPFENAEEVWFWFCTSASARSEGLRSKSDYWGKPRCCELPDTDYKRRYAGLQQQNSSNLFNTALSAAGKLIK